MPPSARALLVGFQLETLRQTMAATYGKEWPSVVAEQKPIIDALMEKSGATSALQAVIPVAKEMKKDGENPMLILAVAAELVCATHTRCGILGCGRAHPTTDSRTYRLGPKHPIPCCPTCWESMGLPPECRDTADYRKSP